MRRFVPIGALVAIALAGCRSPESRGLADLQSGEPARIERAVETLRTETKPDVVAKVNELAKSGEKPATRAGAVKLIGLRHQAISLPLLMNATADPSPEVRAATAEAMGELGHPKALVWLEKQGADDADPSVRAASAAAAKKLHDSAWSFYLEVASDSTAPEEARVSATDLLGSLKDERCVSGLVKLFPSVRTPALQQAIVWTLGDVGSDAALSFVREQLLNDANLVRAAAIYVVGQHRDAPSTQTLTELLEKDSSLENRIAAARALGEIGTPDALAAVKKTMKGKLDPRLERECKLALSGAGRAPSKT